MSNNLEEHVYKRLGDIIRSEETKPKKQSANKDLTIAINSAPPNWPKLQNAKEIIKNLEK